MLPRLLVFACLLAAGYGALHNQVSYTAGPEYFHEFKFIQFGIEPDLRNRLGAAIVGIWASWWMGLVIGLPIVLVCLRAPTATAMRALFIKVALGVVALTLALGLLSLLIPVTPAMLAAIPISPGTADPMGYARAAILHEVSYGAGLLATLVGVIFAFRDTRR